MRLSFIRNEWVGYIRRYNALNLLGRGRLLTRYWFKQGKFLIMNISSNQVTFETLLDIVLSSIA